VVEESVCERLSANTSHIDARESTFWTAGRQATYGGLDLVERAAVDGVASRRKTRESAAYTNHRRVDMASTEESVASLADLLHETSLRHGRFEAVAPPHDWWDWYAAYMNARQGGRTPDEASAAADRYMAEVKNVVVSPA